MHAAVVTFCESVKARFPRAFEGGRVLDCGSLDINGNNRYLFDGCEYRGIDVGEGRNVDSVSLIHEWDGDDGEYDTIISTECFEHDMHLRKSLARIGELIKPGGLFLFTCATTGRSEHGTSRRSKADAPLLAGDAADYYRNVTEDMIADLFDDWHEAIFQTVGTDLQFWGIR